MLPVSRRLAAVHKAVACKLRSAFLVSAPVKHFPSGMVGLCCADHCCQVQSAQMLPIFCHHSISAAHNLLTDWPDTPLQPQLTQHKPCMRQWETQRTPMAGFA